MLGFPGQTLADEEMRVVKFLLSVYWMAIVGSIAQSIVILASIWILSTSSYSFFELDVNVFFTEFFPMFLWVKTFIIFVLGDVGSLILTLPMLIVAPLKLVLGLVIGYWAYSVADTIPKHVSSA